GLPGTDRIQIFSGSSGLAPKPDPPIGEAALPWGGRRPGGRQAVALAEVLRMAPLVTASVSIGLPGRALQRGNFRKGRSGACPTACSSGARTACGVDRSIVGTS